MAHFPYIHAAQAGLLDDDHTQYHNDARGDARYPLKAGTGASGTWPISVTGSAGTATNATTSTSAGGVSTPQGRKWYWADVGPKYYIWTGVASGDNRVIWEGNWARWDHNHVGSYGYQFGYNHIDIGNLAGSTGYGPWAIGHGAGGAPRAAMATMIYDDGAQSVVASIGNPVWDGTNIWLCARNLNVSTGEAAWISQLSWR